MLPLIYTMDEKINKIIIVDDHPLFREGLKSIVNRQEDYEVLGEAHDMESMMKLIHTNTPDIILLDLSLGKDDGFHLLKYIIGLDADIKVMIISMHNKAEFIIQSIQEGASGYIMKESAQDQLVFGMKQVNSDNFFLDSSIPKNVLLQVLKSNGKTLPKESDKLACLTPREKEVFKLLASGLSTKEIAYQLKIAAKTCDNHITNIMRKLDLHSRLELLKFALKTESFA